MSELNNEPLIPASKKLPELTFKAIVIAIILAILLAAANAYLALKIGTTISASIPASVLALGILRFFKQSNVLESNIIQTAASAGEGIAAAIAYILPAMIVLHVWGHFSYWESTSVTLLGGILGVVFSVPLRRVMLNLPTLRFPEGTAIGNVLVTSARKGAFLKNLVNGGIVGGAISFCQSGLQFIGSSLQVWGSVGNSLLGIGVGLTPATLAAGYIIGVEVGVTLLVGLIIGWFLVLPFLALHFGVDHSLSIYDAAMSLWSSHLRFVGVGTMLVGGIWTLLRLISPVIQGLKASFLILHGNKKQRNGEGLIRTEKDISFMWVITTTITISVVLYFLFFSFMNHYDIQPKGVTFLLSAAFFTIIYVVIIGFMLSTICAYFTGLIGSTNNPLSGILIIALILLSLLYTVMFDINYNPGHVAAIVILVAAVVATIAAISNENLQDLKAGQMIGATPWKQQLMLGVGAIVASLIMSPVLNLLFDAYGMAGVFPRSGMDVSQMLSAPQASLMAAVVNGVLTHKLDWDMVLIGAVIAVAIIIVDEFLKRRKHALPALAVGLGIYLPTEITTPIIIGGLINYLVKRSRKSEATQHQGVLLACGIVAGSALMGVILAIPFVILGNSNALAIISDHYAWLTNSIGVIMLVLLCVWFYRISGKSS